MAPTERDGVKRLGMTLDDAAAATGMDRSTIHAIENIKSKPKLKPELETIEKLAWAYRITLSELFARIEDSAPLRPELHDHDSLPPLDSEDRIAQKVVRLLTRFAVQNDQSERGEDDRLPAGARSEAAESGRDARTHRPRNVPDPTQE